MFTVKTQWRKAAFQASVLLVSMHSAVMAQTAPDGCIALAVISNDLWLIQSDSKPLRQLTNDGQLKPAAAISSNGKVIAYSGKPPPNDITFIDNFGRLLVDYNASAKDAIIELKWMDNDVLRAAEHVSPYSSNFSFLKVPTNPFISVAAVSPYKFDGQNCAITSDAKDMACFERDILKLNGRGIFALPSAFEASTTVQTADMSAGTSIVTTTNPTFRIEVKGIDKGTVRLKVTTQDGLFQEQYIKSGESMALDYAGGDVQSAPVYGIVPTIRKSNDGIVTVEIKKSKSGNFSLEASPAWDKRGKRIGFVEANDLGQRFLVLVNRELGNADQNKGGVDLTKLLPIEGPITRIKFTSDTHIRVEGKKQVYEQDIPAQGKVPSDMPYTLTQALPQNINVVLGSRSTNAKIKGWSCQY